MRRLIDSQTIGNIGLFYVCYRLSDLGWNVMPTARNARGIDILIYSQDVSRKWAIEVRTRSNRVDISLGDKLEHLLFDFLVVCLRIRRELECFVLRTDQVRELARWNAQKGEFRLRPREYEVPAYREQWDLIGRGNMLISPTTVKEDDGRAL